MAKLRFGPDDVSHEPFRHLVQAVEDYAIFTLDEHGVITSWNPGAVRMKQYRPDEAIGHHYSMLYPPEGRRLDEPMNHLRIAQVHGRFRGEGVRMRKDGALFLADVLIVAIRVDGELQGFAKFVQDLNEGKALLQERDLTRALVERMRGEADYRERFVATLTHDLRSSVTAVAVAAQMIARTPDDPDKVRRLAVRIEESAARTDRMIGDLLDVARMDAGAPATIAVAPCDLRALVDDVVAEAALSHGDRFDVQQSGDARGIWDATALERVLQNLIGNAVKYGDPDARITIRLHRADDHVHLSVHNLGDPISLDEQRRLFQPFHRTTSAERSGKRGWGLGLVLVRGLVDAHGGGVKVTSLAGEGTTFIVDLPVEARAVASSAQPGS